jgi:predicted ATPase
MLTITGPIGIGKSALARHAVAQYGSEFSDGVAYVKVEQAATDSELCVALAEVLNLPANVRWHDIVQAVRQQQLLIVLDGCDGSYLTAEKLRMLLHAAPEVKLLIAATKRLNVRGEWTLALTGLSIPTNMAQFEVSDSSAVLLFLYHAKRINRDFELQSHDLQTVAQICQLVDGVPLGIELAANWVRVFTCEEIRQEIAANFHFLTTKQNGIPDHHKSIASAVNLTWQRLAPEERALLRICSIFRGSFSRQAFEEVAGDSVMTLASLLDRSLIERLEDGRFRMPEMLRQFSAEQFSTNTNQRNEIRKRYTQFYASFLATIAPALTGQQQIGALSQREAIERVDLEIANLQQAWRWAIADHNSQFLHGATAFMAHYFEIKGQITEGSAWLTEAEVVFRDEPRLHAILLANLGWFSHLAERSEQALDMLQRATTSLKLTGQQSEIVLPLCKLAIVAHSLGAVDAAHNYLRRSLAVSKTYDDHDGAAWTLFAAATVAHSTGEPERARRLSEQSLGMQQRSGNLWGMAQTLELLGQISFSSCGFIESRRCFEDARFHYGALENTRCVAVCSENLGKVASAIGDWQQAQQYHQDALDVFEKLNDMKGIGRSQLQIGRILRASQAYQAAQKQFLLALKTAIAQQWSQLASTILAEWQNLIHETRHRGIQLTLATAIDTQSGVDDPLVSRLVNQFMAIAQRDYTQQNEAQIDGLVSAYFGSRQTNLQTLSLE